LSKDSTDERSSKSSPQALAKRAERSPVPVSISCSNSD
jgi:hypothetical protein